MKNQDINRIDINRIAELCGVSREDMGRTAEELFATVPEQSQCVKDEYLDAISADAAKDAVELADDVPAYVPTAEDLKMADKVVGTVSDTMKALSLSSAVKGRIVYENYVNSHPMLSGQQKRAVRREIERNAKKGKYDGLFEGKSFNKINGK